MIEINENDKIMNPKYNMRTPKYKGCLVYENIPVFINLLYQYHEGIRIRRRNPTL